MRGLLLESPLWSVMSAYILDLSFRHVWLSARYTIYAITVCATYKLASCLSDDRLDWSLLCMKHFLCNYFLAVLMTEYLLYKCMRYNVHPTLFSMKWMIHVENWVVAEVHFQGYGYYSDQFQDIYVLHPHFVAFFLQKIHILVTVWQRAVIHLKQTLK